MFPSAQTQSKYHNKDFLVANVTLQLISPRIKTYYRELLTNTLHKYLPLPAKNVNIYYTTILYYLQRWRTVVNGKSSPILNSKYLTQTDWSDNKFQQLTQPTYHQMLYLFRKLSWPLTFCWNKSLFATSLSSCSCFSDERVVVNRVKSLWLVCDYNLFGGYEHICAC